MWKAHPKARPGDYKFIDLNQDGIIDGDDRANIGNPFPDFTFGFYSGLDPEVGGWGIDSGNYPQPRTYMAGVNIEF